MSVSLYGCLFTMCMPGTQKVKRGLWIPKNWNYGWLYVATRVLGLRPGSSAQTIGALNLSQLSEHRYFNVRMQIATPLKYSFVIHHAGWWRWVMKAWCHPSPGRWGEIARLLLRCWSADGMTWGDGKSRKTEKASPPLPCSLTHGCLSCVINCHSTSDVFFITYCRICDNKRLWRLCSISPTYVSQVTDPTPLGNSEKKNEDILCACTNPQDTVTVKKIRWGTVCIVPKKVK